MQQYAISKQHNLPPKTLYEKHINVYANKTVWSLSKYATDYRMNICCTMKPET